MIGSCMILRRHPDSPTRTIILPAPFLSASDFNESKVFGPPLFCPFRPSLSCLFSCKSELPILQPLCFDNHTNCRGVGGVPPTLISFWEETEARNKTKERGTRGAIAPSGTPPWLVAQFVP